MRNENMNGIRPLKLLVALAAALCVCLAAAAAVSAAPGPVTLRDVIEKPEVRIVIDGVSREYTDVPLEINDRILLPLRELLTRLGVANDDEHIIWNDADQSVTVNHGDRVIKLVTGDPVMMLNGEAITANVAPYNYAKNGRTYIPVRAVSELMDKLVLWEESTTSVYVRDRANHAATVELLETVQAAGEQTKTAATAEADYTISISSPDIEIPGSNSEGVLTTAGKVKMDIKADLDENTFYVSQQTSMLGVAVNQEYFIFDGKIYADLGMGQGWQDVTDQGGVDMESMLGQAQFLDGQFGEISVEDIAMGVMSNKAADGSYMLSGELVNMGDVNELVGTFLRGAELGDGMNMEMKINELGFTEKLDADCVAEEAAVTVDCDMAMTQTDPNGNAAVINLNMAVTMKCVYEDIPEDFAIDMPAGVMALIRG